MVDPLAAYILLATLAVREIRMAAICDRPDDDEWLFADGVIPPRIRPRRLAMPPPIPHAQRYHDWHRATFAKGPHMPATPPPKRNGLMRALGAVKSGASVDYQMDRLADLVEGNNARAMRLASEGIEREDAKGAMLDQIEREHALDELERAMGANFPPPLSEAAGTPSPTTDAPLASANGAKADTSKSSTDEAAK